MTGRSKLRRWLRGLLVALALVAAVLVVIRLLLDPVATRLTRKALDDADNIRGDFHSVHVTVFPPGYQIRRLKIVENLPRTPENPRGRDDWEHPLFYAERVHVGIDWRELFHARLAGRVRLDRPKIVISKREDKRDEKAVPDVSDVLSRVTPLRVDRIEIRGGELVYRDLTAPRRPELWLHDLGLSLSNLATRPALARGRRISARAQGKLGRSGDIRLAASADPFTRKLAFSGELAVQGWRVAELFDLVEPATDLQTPEGTLDLFAEFEAEAGLISGGIKPVLKNVKVRPTEDEFGNKLKAWIADKALRLFSDEVPQGRQAATVIPIKGRIDDPELQLWPALVGVIRNAFVEGISAGFADLPPPTADKRQGKIEQLADGLQKDKGPPKAQPVPDAREPTRRKKQR